MKIFVTGGTGFIGSYVLRELVKAGHKNILASKRVSSNMSLVKGIPHVEWIECDLLDVMEMDDIFKECDQVIHMAGSVSFSPWKKKQIFETNIELTANLINLALDHNIRRFIHFSSVAALGLSSKTMDETQVWTENNSNSVYSLSKYLGEKEAWRGFAEGLNLSIINPSFTIGGSFWNEGPMSMITKIDKGLKYYPRGTNGAVDVRDVAQMCVKLLENDKMSGRRFICSGHNISHYDLMCMMCDALYKPYPTKPLDGFLGEIIWRGASMVARLQGTETLLSKEAYQISSAHCTYDNSQSLELLGMEYHPIKKTIEETISCYQQSKANGFGVF